jgi:exopolysaccharide biosynthesis protein
MKHVFKSLLVVVLLVNLAFVFAVKANPTVNFDSEVIKKYTEVVTEDVYGVATINSSTITTYNGAVIDEKKLADHKSYWLEPNVSLADSDLRVVNYTSGSATNWDGKRPTELAKIYEKENPGWIVVGGINGDFFWIEDNCEIQGTSMQETDFYKPYDYNCGEHKAIGFKNDGSYVYGIVDASDKQYVQVLGEDGKYTDVAMIDGVDETPSATGVTLLSRFTICTTPYKDIDITGTLPFDVSGYKVYKVKYDVQRLDRDGSAEVGENRVFVKGTVVEIVDDLSTLAIDDKEQISYLVSKDGSLDALNIGDQVRCQCKLEGEWADVTNISSAYNQILENGVVLDYDRVGDFDSTYVNCVKNRTIMGFKADGTPVMMVVEKGGYGASYEECGEILKGLGCVDGFLFDGGGSSCIFIRDNFGGFTSLNNHQDGRERSDGNAVLLVKRDPGFNIVIDDIERFSATVKLSITNEEYFGGLSNVKVTVNGVTKDYSEEGLVFDNLEEDTPYDVVVTYDLQKNDDVEKIVTSSHTKEFRTRMFFAPSHGLSVSEVTGSTIKVVKNTNNDTHTWVQDVVIHIGRAEYNMGNANEFVCTDLMKNAEYEMYYEYKIVDPASGKVYDFVTDPKLVYTAAYDAPSIVKFEENKKSDDSITFDYEYIDEDKLVVKAYISCNGEVAKEVSTKSGSTTIRNLELGKENYEFKFVVEYENENGETFKVESSVLTYEGNGENTTPPSTQPAPSGGCALGGTVVFVQLFSAISVIALAFRKRK